MDLWKVIQPFKGIPRSKHSRTAKQLCCFCTYALRCKTAAADSTGAACGAQIRLYTTRFLYIYSMLLTLSRVPAEVDTAETCGLHSNACEGRLSGQLAHYSTSMPDRSETHKTNAAAHPKGHLWILMCNFNWTCMRKSLHARTRCSVRGKHAYRRLRKTLHFTWVILC